MTRPIISITDVITGETVDREMTDDELAQLEIDRQETAARLEAEIADQQAKALAKAALLERLGMTAEEAALLLS
jgi:hypothetical protein